MTHLVLHRLGSLLCLLSLAACSAVPVKKEIHGSDLDANQVVQSDSNRAANLAMRDNLESLSLLLEKLYKRNLAQWKKTGFRSLEEARQKVIETISNDEPLPGLNDKKSVDALPLAFDQNFQGDRAGALVYGIGTMLTEVYGGRTQLYLIHGLDAQKLANAAWNIEVAMWLLSSRTDVHGQPLLLSNEISANGRNLSFEREFGRMLGRLELLAQMNDEKYRRSAINYVQGILGAPLLQFLPLEAVSTVIQQ